MIKKFKLFINESFKDDVMSEYKILHLNKKEKIDYFEDRIYDFENIDWNRKDIESHWDRITKVFFLRRKNDFWSTYYTFTSYEFDLCPNRILQRYIDLCIKYGLGIPYECLDSLNTKQKELFLDSCAKNAKQSYVNITIIKLFSDKQMYVYLVNLAKNHFYLADKDFDYLSDKFRKFYLYKCAEFNLKIQDDFFTLIENGEYYRNYYIDKCFNKCIITGKVLDSSLLKYLSDEKKTYLLYKTFRKRVIK